MVLQDRRPRRWPRIVGGAAPWRGVVGGVSWAGASSHAEGSGELPRLPRVVGRIKRAAPGWWLSVSQLKQVSVLPLSFFGYGIIGMRGAAGPMDGLYGIVRSADAMGGDMGSCHRLTCGPGRRASGIILSYLASSSMRCQRSLAYLSHLKHPGIYPCLECFECIPRAMVFWIFFLKIGQNTLNTINGPGAQGRMVGSSRKRDHRLVSACNREFGACHGITFSPSDGSGSASCWAAPPQPICNRTYDCRERVSVMFTAFSHWAQAHPYAFKETHGDPVLTEPARPVRSMFRAAASRSSAPGQRAHPPARPASGPPPGGSTQGRSGSPDSRRLAGHRPPAAC